MATVLLFPRHARASSRPAKRASKSMSTPAAIAFSVERTRGHHFEGMLSRLNHLITAQFPAPTSAAIASLDSQRSMTERNEEGAESDMPQSLGQFVPNCKAVMSHDLGEAPGHSVPMSDQPEKMAESAWREAFSRRLRQIQGNRTQDQMAGLLGISRDTWNKCLNRNSAFPIRLLPKLAAIGEMSVQDLIAVEKASSTSISQPKTRAPRRKRA